MGTSESKGAGHDEIRVNLVSLGCPKNLVDSEMILGRLGEEGFVVTPSPEEADVIIVNTCGFVQSAKEESINAILELCELKKESPTPKSIVVTGCLSQRYGAQLRQEMPELDAIFGLGEYGKLGRAVREIVGKPNGTPYYRVGDPTRACNADVGRFRLTPRHFAYLRISEGCDNPCTFCAIPAIRGRYRSKPIDVLEQETRELTESGARELILISQDTTSYGVDIDGKSQLHRLLERLARVDGVRWIRVLYAYPAFLTDDMIDALASIDKVVKYLDLPLQHISDPLLKRMGRRLNETRTRRLLEKLRLKIPGVYLRTTFLVGFPGEADRDFGTLCDFAREFQFERMGVFQYSPEDGTPALGFADQVPEEIAEARLEELMLLQQEIAFRLNRRRLEEKTEVVVDSLDVFGEKQPPGARARSHGEAPEIDPHIILTPSTADGEEPGLAPKGPDSERRDGDLSSGDFLKVRITGTIEYDLLATPLEETPEPGTS